MSKANAGLNRDSMAARVKREILDRILRGDFPPGSRLVEMQLAREFNSSQGPVREALRELEGMGIVTTEAYKGTRVREVTVEDVRDAYLVRASLEELAARLAAPLLKGNTQKLRKEAQAALNAAKRNQVLLYNQHNIEFHRLIVEASANQILIRAWNSFSFEVHIQFRLLRDKVDLVPAQAPHWEALEALDQGNGELAARILRDHVLHSIPKPL